ncbi:MAG: Transglutaminase-like superfamily [Frankiaceae bacterium]|jgi:hypothetical protein|nr:Transglutaminase-like superfamily [Frankiaceae bacterium]
MRLMPPSPASIRQFAQAVRRPTRLSTLRAVPDGAYVTLTLKRRGLRPLLKSAPEGLVRDAEQAVAVAAAIDAGLALLPAVPTCLRRSVTLLRELRRLGLDGTLHIGVRTSTGEFQAHAWVQVADTVVNDEPVVTNTYAEISAGAVERVLPALK